MQWLRNRSYFRALALLCSIAFAPGEALLYGQSPQQSTGGANQQKPFMSPEQLDSLVAPLALYPDPLLGQVLAASTYPLQIVMAERWVRQNNNLEDKALLQAARQPGGYLRTQL